MEKIRLLLVESHKLMRQAWLHVLSNDDNVKVVADCASHDDAMFLCHTVKPDVVLFNIGMNLNLDFAAMEYILQEFPAIKLIGMSMNSRPVLAQSVLDAGAHGFVTKSSSREELVRAITEVCHGHIYICSEVRELTA